MAASPLIILILARLLTNLNATAQAVPSTKHDASSALSQQIPNVNIPNTTFLNALFQIERLTNQCFGVALTQRSSATTEVQNVNAENIAVKDLIGIVLKASTGFEAREEAGWLVIAQARDKPSYLKTTIPSFRTQRSPIELQSYALFQALSATEARPLPRAV
jgi:hypothetical protein